MNNFYLWVLGTILTYTWYTIYDSPDTSWRYPHLTRWLVSCMWPLVVPLLVVYYAYNNASAVIKPIETVFEYLSKGILKIKRKIRRS